MHKHFESFTCLDGNECKTYVYNHVGQGWASGEKLDSEIYAAAKEYSPNLIVYIGACSGNLPSPKGFKRLRDEMAPTVHFCSDAADEPWWPQLRIYDKEKSFNVQVALDGNKNWPLHDTEITALTPLDPKWYPSPLKPHSGRSVIFGFAGNPGSAVKLKDGKVLGRRPIVAEMIKFGLQYRARTACNGKMEDSIKSYSEAAQYMLDTRIMPNISFTGSYEKYHVKGRVIEAGWAGCLLLEQKGSPTPDWFEPGVDYLEYDTTVQAKEIIEKYWDKPDETQVFGERLRKKVEENHSPEKFWGRIIERL